jgi:23S rRNA (uracil1939-C5)-methyltransferase
MPGSNELLLGVVVTRADFSERVRLGKDLWAITRDLRDEQGRPVECKGVVANINAATGNVLLGAATEPMRGDVWQTDTVAGLRLRVSFTSFYQQNRHADAILFRPALAMLGDVKGLRVVDGYGGVGAFGLRLLRAGAAHVTIVESSPSACDDARTNLAANDLADRGEVREQPFGSAPLPECDLLVADPPRAGLMEQGAAAVLAAAPPRVLLVSCALESLARDLPLLAAKYRVTALRLCDLFPHTEHVEAVTLLERR